MKNYNLIEKIKDECIRKGVKEAIRKTLKKATLELAYPGHFTVTADGSGYGTENTWPGLDSWEMAGAFLMLGQHRLVLDYFDFVQGAQRKDGNIPFAVFPAETEPPYLNSFYKGLKYPEDIYTYRPNYKKGQKKFSDMSEKKWIGLFEHWISKENPLSVLAPICSILTLYEIFETLHSLEFLEEKLPSAEATGIYLLSQKHSNGLISGSGFYTELPPRYQYDGITQCYSINVFNQLSELFKVLGNIEKMEFWKQSEQELRQAFQSIFWKEDHFAEYVHFNGKLVDSHGLSDVNWAAIAFNIADKSQIEALWPKLSGENGFWYGGMPTMPVTKPFTYEAWEFNEEVSFKLEGRGPLFDVAAMGRVWYLETLACERMGDYQRLIDSVKKVCEMGKKNNWYWHERYQPLQNGKVYAEGPKGYCEYAAVLVRVVLGNIEHFI